MYLFMLHQRRYRGRTYTQEDILGPSRPHFCFNNKRKWNFQEAYLYFHDNTITKPFLYNIPPCKTTNLPVCSTMWLLSNALLQNSFPHSQHCSWLFNPDKLWPFLAWFMACFFEGKLSSHVLHLYLSCSCNRYFLKLWTMDKSLCQIKDNQL